MLCNKYRLTSASASAASSSPFSQSFTYDVLGNMLTNSLSLGEGGASTTAPSIMDSLPLTLITFGGDITSDSRSYTVPSGGSNKVFVLLIAKAGDGAPTATLNGASLTTGEVPGTHDRAAYYYGYLANPSSGTFYLTLPSAQNPYYALFTLENAAQASSIDASAVTNNTSASTKSTSVTTSAAYDLLLSYPNCGIMVSGTV